VLLGSIIGASLSMAKLESHLLLSAGLDSPTREGLPLGVHLSRILLCRMGALIIMLGLEVGNSDGCTNDNARIGSFSF
jgi:hypothetical protein